MSYMNERRSRFPVRAARMPPPPVSRSRGPYREIAAALRSIQHTSSVLVLDAGVTLFDAERPARSLYLVRSGLIQVTITGNAGGDDLVLDLLGRGAMLGEGGIATNGQERLAAATLVSSTLVAFPVAAVRDVARRSPATIDLLVGLFDYRLTRAVELATEISSFPVERRLATLLVRLSDAHGRALTDGSTVVAVPVHQGDLARMIGTSRQRISTTISAWRAHGVVRTPGGRLTITDLDWLAAIAGGADARSLRDCGRAAIRTGGSVDDRA